MNLGWPLHLANFMSAEIETLHIPFRKWLDSMSDVLYTYHRPDCPTGGTLGDADFILYGCGGRCLHLEMKDKETKISPAQKKRHEAFAKIGITVHIIRDLKIAETIVTQWRSMIGEPINLTAQPPGAVVTFGGKKFREVNGELIPMST